MVAVHDVPSTYHVPVLLETQGMLQTLRDLLHLNKLTIPEASISKGSHTWNAWRTLTDSQEHIQKKVTIALVGKYTGLHDSYLSVIKSLEHSAMSCSRELKLVWVDSTHLEPRTEKTSASEYYKAWHEICTADGILVPGGFGGRGIEGMVAVVSKVGQSCSHCLHWLIYDEG